MEHRVETTDYESERSYYYCSCGMAGSASTDNIDVVSDRHIDYPNGDTRIDVRRPKV